MGGSEKVEQAFAEGFGYLRKHFKNKEDLEFLEDPLRHLTRSFVADLNRIGKHTRVALFFDTYEYLAPFCDAWLCKTLLGEELSDQIMLVFAGRDQFSPRWLDYQPLTRPIPLDVFTDEEARTFLSSRGVTDAQQIEEVLKISGRLPVYLAMLTSQAGGAARESGKPTENVVERFLKWIPTGESDKRRAVVQCAFPRYFNKDVLRALLESEEADARGEELFAWLHNLPFISSLKKKGWVYHELVRTQILEYACQESPREYQEIHARLRAYYRQQPGQESVMEEIYHLLHCDPEQGIHLSLAGIFRTWIEEESLEVWMAQIYAIMQQHDKEPHLKDPVTPLWRTHLTHIGQQKPESEPILQQLAVDDSLDPAARSGAYYNLGVLLARQQRFDEAEQAYRQAIDLKSDLAGAYNNLGILLRKQQRVDEAEQAYRQAIECKSDFAEAYNNLGNLLADQQRLDEAEQAYRQAIDLKSDLAGAYNNLGNLLRKQQRVDEAEQAYRQALEHQPDDANAYNNLGNLLADQQRLDEAEQAYRQALEHQPDDANAYNNLGNLLADQQRLDEAEQAYRQALEHQPDDANAYNNLGILLADQQRLDEAEQAYRQALEHQPDHANAYNNLGILLADQQRLDEAEQAYRQAIDLKPDFAEAYNNLGFLLANQQRVDEAEQAYRKVIELEPESSSGYWNLGLLLYLQEKWQDFVQVSRQGLAVDPSNASIQFNIALALLCQGNSEEARAEYQKGLALADADTRQKAITVLQEALAKYPNLPAASDILRQLQATR